MVRTAIIGVGGMGMKYAKMIIAGKAEGLMLTAAVCRRQEPADDIAKAVSESDYTDNVKIYSSADELYANPDEYDAVLIVTPHKTHPDLVIKAFELGKHVLCDKPVAVAVGDAIRMNEAAKKAGTIYACMFHQRRYPKYMKIKEILDNKELGRLSRVMLVNSRYFRTKHYHDSGSWRSSWKHEGGGALINQGQHILDIWQWLLGMPKKLYADIPFGKYNDFAVDDEATIQMRYDDKLTAVFMLTTGEAIWQERFEITGTKGKILLEDNVLHIYKYSEDSVDYMKRATTNSREELTYTEEIIDFGKTIEPYEEMLSDFAKAIDVNDNSLVAAPGISGINALMLNCAAYYSAVKGCQVELPLDAGAYDELLDELCKTEA